MKIALDISQIVYGTGVSNYSENLVRSLLKIDPKNQYILFASSLRNTKKFKELEEKLSGTDNVEFKILRIPPSILEFLWNKLHIYPIDNIIGHVDVFHSSDWLQPPVKSKNTKKVTTVHDMVADLFPSSLHPRIIANQKRRMKYVKKEVDAIIADSETTKEDIVKFLEIPQEKISVIYLAASDVFTPQKEDQVNQVLEKYKIKKPFILSVATQEPRKNLQKLLDAFEVLIKDYPTTSLVLVGKYGWGKGLRVSDNVIWTNYIPEEDLKSLYSACRVFVYPSLWEGFGLPILEAMACGAPVITSNNSSMKEIAHDVAILIDPRNEKQITKAMEFMLNLDMESYGKMVQASFNRAKDYSWEKTARETLKVYEKITQDEDRT